MSVIVAATALSTNPGLYSPQHVNNWTIELEGIFDGGPLSLSLSRAFLPTVGNDELAVPFGNETTYYAGRARQEGGTVEVRDYVDADIQGLLTDWYTLVYPGIRDREDGRVNVPIVYKKIGNILISAPDGTGTRVWKLHGLFPLQYSPGQLDMGSSEQVTVSMSLRYDKAVYVGPQR